MYAIDTGEMLQQHETVLLSNAICAFLGYSSGSTGIRKEIIESRVHSDSIVDSITPAARKASELSDNLVASSYASVVSGAPPLLRRESSDADTEDVMTHISVITDMIERKILEQDKEWANLMEMVQEADKQGRADREQIVEEMKRLKSLL